jgi:putative transposase
MRWLAERVNGILKNELLLHRPKDFVAAIRMVEESVQFAILFRTVP